MINENLTISGNQWDESYIKNNQAHTIPFSMSRSNQLSMSRSNQHPRPVTASLMDRHQR